ncbi:unnamed protein product [Hydatigera taeniaeformis]|uniref:Uncharacterized protein n=1 Tax=Hydatigena taeniaeformis TaxID=6205 RepID=A0A3P7GQ14_HYDTA|nr:unnamed protein product [Hydatigera taeniaeformis]
MEGPQLPHRHRVCQSWWSPYYPHPRRLHCISQHRGSEGIHTGINVAHPRCYAICSCIYCPRLVSPLHRHLRPPTHPTWSRVHCHLRSSGDQDQPNCTHYGGLKADPGEETTLPLHSSSVIYHWMSNYRWRELRLGKHERVRRFEVLKRAVIKVI